MNRNTKKMKSRKASSRRRSSTTAGRRKATRFWIMVALGIGAVIWGTAPATGLFEHDPKTTSEDGAQRFEGLQQVKMPSATPSQIKEYEGFTVSFNSQNHTPNWVAWELLGTETEGPNTRSDKFWGDPDINGCPEPTDYKRSGYDKGHMCPAADQKWSTKAMNDCFVMTNMCPQQHALNAGAWKTLEEKERQWAKRDSALVIIAGPVYDASDRHAVGPIGVRVPSAFFKILLAPYAEQPRAIAFVYPNMSAPGNMQQYATTVDAVEELTGYDFFAALPDDVEQAVESTFSFNDWNRTQR